MLRTNGELFYQQKDTTATLLTDVTDVPGIQKIQSDQNQCANI